MSQYSNLELKFGPREIQSSKATLEEWRNDSVKIGALHTLTIMSWFDKPDDPTYQDLIDTVIQFFSSGKDHLRNFQTLEWEARSEFPPSLLRMFEANYPSWSIHLISFPESSAIFSSPAVISLSVILDRRHLSEDETALPNVQSAIQSSKSLKKLHLYIDVFGCVQYLYSTEFSENGETFPPLEELVLEWFWISQRCGEYWTKAMDWSHLRVLDFREGSLSTAFLPLLLPTADKLPALESIGMTLPCLREEDLQKQKGDPNSSFSLIRRLLSTALPGSLRDVRVWGYSRQFLPDIIDNHGTSLKSLSLHDEESSSEDDQRTPLSVGDLKEIGTKTKGLEVLALDVNILEEHAWPEDVIDVLASPMFFSLKKLEVFSLIGISKWSRFESRVALATTEEDVKSLALSLSATPLEEIKVQIGEKRMIRGFPAGWLMWEMDHRKTVAMMREQDEWASPIISKETFPARRSI